MTKGEIEPHNKIYAADAECLDFPKQNPLSSFRGWLLLPEPGIQLYELSSVNLGLVAMLEIFKAGFRIFASLVRNDEVRDWRYAW